jgi:hypothetical protein
MLGVHENHKSNAKTIELHTKQVQYNVKEVVTIAKYG